MRDRLVEGQALLIVHMLMKEHAVHALALIYLASRVRLHCNFSLRFCVFFSNLTTIHTHTLPMSAGSLNPMLGRWDGVKHKLGFSLSWNLPLLLGGCKLIWKCGKASNAPLAIPPKGAGEVSRDWVYWGRTLNVSAPRPVGWDPRYTKVCVGLSGRIYMTLYIALRGTITMPKLLRSRVGNDPRTAGTAQ